jgi:hypothetical protein
MTAPAVTSQAQRKARMLREQAEALEAIGDTFHAEQDYRTALALDRIVRQVRELSESILSAGRGARTRALPDVSD